MKAKSVLQDFPLVCIGGAAFELEAYTELVRSLPADLGAAIVIINRVKAVANKLLAAIPHCTEMPVAVITEGLLVQPNRVFILQEGHDLHVLDGEFHLKPISKPTGWTDVVTVFLRSMTEWWHGQLVAVILSGLDGDGSAALSGIKKAGGITIAQSLDTAADPNMPSSAIASGYVDFILSIEDIAKKIVQIAQEAKSGSSRR